MGVFQTSGKVPEIGVCRGLHPPHTPISGITSTGMKCTLIICASLCTSYFVVKVFALRTQSHRQLSSTNSAK